MFVVKCPRCGQRSKAFVDHAGRRGRCPHCAKRIIITASPDETPSDELRHLIAEPDRKTRKGRERVKLPDTSPPAALLAVVAVAVTWVFFRFGGEWLTGTVLGPAWEVVQSCMWIGRVEVFLFLWGLLLLVWKVGLWRRQRRTLRWAVFPGQFTDDTRITPSDVDGCLAYVQTLSRRPTRSILLNRVSLALQHFRQTRRLDEVRGALTGQSAIDANMLDSSYSMLRFLIWVVPITGFIGTVLGIGIAVGEFADFIPKVSEVEKAMDSLRNGLGQVTTGLGTAFNTTLVALCLVAPLMLLTSWLRKLEEQLLAEIDHFSNHDLLGRLEE